MTTDVKRLSDLAHATRPSSGGVIPKIMRHEWRSLNADRTLWVLAGLLALLIGYGVYNGARWVEFRHNAVQEAQVDERDRYRRHQAAIPEIEAGRKEVSSWLDPRFPSVASYSVGTRYAVMPPGPLAALSVGQSDLYPYYFRVSRLGKETFVNNDEIENPTILLAGRFDLAFVIVYLFPLLILAVSYNLLSAEREQGTLAMAMSQPVALRSFVLGKVGLRALVVLLIAAVCSLLGFLVAGISFWEDGALWRLGFWIAIVAAYGAFWFGLALLINAVGKSSATNAMMLFALWLVFVLIVPSIFNLVVTSVYPVPSRVEMIQATRRASAEATARGSELLSRYYEDHPELAPANALDPNEFFNRTLAVQEETDRLRRPVMEHFDRQVAGQQSLVNRFRFISPAIVVQTALNDLAGTDPARYQHFHTLVDGFHQRWRDYFIPRIRQQEKIKLTPADYDNFPTFAFREEASRPVVGRTFAGLLGLIMPAGVVAGVGLFRLRRYEVAG
jgi:ABC-2 type transport system permease protein